MKKLIVMLAVSLAASAQATLIDLTPGGTNWNDPIIEDWYSNTRPHLWLFNQIQDRFTVTGLGTSEVTLSWDLRGLGSFKYLFVISNEASDTGVSINFYQVPFREWRTGEAVVTVDGVLPIAFLNEFGTFDAPEAGTGALLLALGIGSILGFRIWLRA
jgi:hypothetical protein